MNQYLFCDNWYFLKTDLYTPMEVVKKRQEEFKPIEIPHDWLIYDTKNLYENSIGWYYKQLDWQKSKDTLCILRFEGVYMDSIIYVNGREAFEWKYGYSTFEADITDYIVFGINEIMVKVTHQSPNSRWYSGAGIYRKVWIKTPQKTRLVSDGIYISTKEKADGYQVHVEVETAHSKGCEIQCTIEGMLMQVEVLEEKTNLDFFIESPRLWDIETPNLYILTCNLIQDGIIIDQKIVRFGLRTIELKPESGFYLNHRHIKLNGVCNHHDLGALGAAVNKEATRRQLLIEKKMGANAIRTSHNMPSVEFLELADELGMLVVNEAFDMWESCKTKYDYGRYFKEWYKKDVKSWITRDRNHPCIIMWSIGNEVYDTHAGEHGQEVMRSLIEQVQKYDPYENAVLTFGSNYIAWENTQKCADIIKVVGYNYSEKYYDEHHEAHPDWVIYGSETSSTVQSRGIYHFPLRQSVLADEDEQCSALGNSTTSWGARSPEACIIAERDHPFSMGQFLWSGFDYIGEPTPYHTKNSYFGQIDTAGFPKDSFYIYQAEWTDYKKTPMVHVFPYWDFNPGQTVDVRIASNAPQVELFVNQISKGRFDIDHTTGMKLLADYLVPYEAGEITAVGYDENGIEIARETRYSFNDPNSIAVVVDKEKLVANGEDIVFMEIGMVDEKGYPVENANNRIHVRVEGEGRLVGLDNGDSTDYEQYKGSSRCLFSGKLLAMVASTTQAGEVKVILAAVGMEEKVVVLHSEPVEEEPVKLVETLETVVTEKKQDKKSLAKEENNNEENNKEENNNEEDINNIESITSSSVLIRKIEMRCNTNHLLNKAQPEAKIEVRLFPADTTIDQLEFSIMNNAGIASNLAEITLVREKEKLTTDEKDVGIVKVLTVRANGDGEFLLRATTKNGKNQVRVMSVLDFEVEGLGQMYLNPYKLISGGLYNDVIGNATNGNDHGVATARGERTVVGFKGVDFGENGSDEITLSVFELEGSRCEIRIWDGKPEEMGKLFYIANYQKPSIWNIYQEETYQLPERLTGIHDLYFELHQKIHLKGFWFKKISKAFDKLFANQNQSVYGDQLKVTEDGVMDIGNNVTLEFTNMDFSQEGCSSIRICGRTCKERNTIHVRFFDGIQELRQVIEFEHKSDFSEQEFALHKVTGEQKVSFVFMPGSQFDFKWFQFIK